MFNRELFLALAATRTIHASPLDWLLPKRQVESQMTDGKSDLSQSYNTVLTTFSVDILQHALTLEHLEDKFYREGLETFTQADFAASGFNRKTYKNIQTISAHETAHVEFLTSALQGASISPVQE